MTEKLLRDVIKEAKEKKQLGIVIWSSWTTWENMGQGNKEVEDLAMEQIAEGKEATMNIKCGFSMPAFIAIPVEKFEKNILITFSMLAKQGVTKVQSSLFRQMNLANSFKEVKEVPVWEPLKFLL